MVYVPGPRPPTSSENFPYSGLRPVTNVVSHVPEFPSTNTFRSGTSTTRTAIMPTGSPVFSRCSYTTPCHVQPAFADSVAAGSATIPEGTCTDVGWAGCTGCAPSVAGTVGTAVALPGVQSGAGRNANSTSTKSPRSSVTVTSESMSVGLTVYVPGPRPPTSSENFPYSGLRPVTNVVSHVPESSLTNTFRSGTSTTRTAMILAGSPVFSLCSYTMPCHVQPDSGEAAVSVFCTTGVPCVTGTTVISGAGSGDHPGGGRRANSISTKSPSSNVTSTSASMPCGLTR